MVEQCQAEMNITDQSGQLPACGCRKETIAKVRYQLLAVLVSHIQPLGYTYSRTASEAMNVMHVH